MTWLAKQAEGATPLDTVYGLLPEAYARHQALVEHIWRPGLVDPVVLELCRLRVAQLVRCDRELAARTPAAITAGLTESKIAQLTQWPTSADYSDAERAALCFAEMYVIDPGSVTDAMTAAVNEHFKPSEVAVLTTGIAVFDAIARFQVALAV
jgi:alkylhydroperoxidase family enzyme